LGERLNGIQEVGGSTPPGSTSLAVPRRNSSFLVVLFLPRLEN
jgi:hypothetical protein